MAPFSLSVDTLGCFELLKYLDREPVLASERVLRPLLQAFLTLRKALVPRPLSARATLWQPYRQALRASLLTFRQP